MFAFINGLPTDEGAMAQYSTALGQSAPTEDQRIEIQELRKTANANIALCHLKLNAPEKALKHCDEVLAIDPNHVKALVRKAQAYLALGGEWEEVSTLLTTAQSVDPNNATIRRLWTEQKGQQKAENKRQKATYSKMFN